VVSIADVVGLEIEMARGVLVGCANGVQFYDHGLLKRADDEFSFEELSGCLGNFLALTLVGLFDDVV
jgi:hypothetical protein